MVWVKGNSSPWCVGGELGSEDKKVDVLGYKPQVKDVWGCSGPSQELWDTVKGWPVGWHQLVTTGKDLQLHAGCDVPLSFPRGALPTVGPEQHTPSRVASDAGRVLPPWCEQDSRQQWHSETGFIGSQENENIHHEKPEEGPRSDPYVWSV